MSGSSTPDAPAGDASSTPDASSTGPAPSSAAPRREPFSGAPRVVLVGPPGAGKSTVGAMVADRLGVPFVDTDDLVAERGGAPVGDLMIDLGENGFRALEREVVVDALGTGGVLALGSGAVEYAVPLLERYVDSGGTVVLLDVSMSAGVPRVGLNAPRSVALGSARAQFAAMAAARRPVYERVARTVVDTSSLSVAEVAERVLAAVG
ncbi:shikimate kinase [Georgenia daeguensis]|uniref:Shikimate kinase n=1 Tax=Georgenia daeguensis TaxID=908355 RepID=A0ABP8EPU5_9MICO